jgi:CubicO group peptidase (beta-lactamase class C family)
MRWSCCLCALLLLVPHTLAAQATVPELQLKEPIARELAPPDTHAYRVAVESGQFVFLAVDQLGVDVIVRLLDPDGELVHEVDGPVPFGMEEVPFVPEATGAYTVQIAAYDSEDSPGRYAVVLERREPVAATPSGRIDQLLAPWSRGGSPGAALAVMRDGEILYEQGYGLANLEYGVPITPETVFNAASVSKQFTAFAIALLADRGALSLDDDIRDHVPEVPDFGKTITLRHLIHHTSGLREQFELAAHAGLTLGDAITNSDVLRLVARQRELNFDPGEQYLYCNTGYVLLAEVVSRVTGQSFPEWTAKNIFGPLEMANTRFVDNVQLLVPNRAYPYGFTWGGGYRKWDEGYVTVGPGGLFTTAGDLLKWARNLEDARVGGPAVVAQMHVPGVLNNGDTIRYVWGNRPGEVRGLRTYYHNGMSGGFKVHLIRYPDQHLAIAVLGNMRTFWPDEVGEQIAELYLSEEMEALEEPTAGGGPPRSRPEPYVPTREQLLEYVGEYASEEMDAVYTLSLEGERLVMTHMRYDPIGLRPTAADEFAGNVWFIRRVRFERDEEREITGLRISGPRARNLLFVRHRR